MKRAQQPSTEQHRSHTIKQIFGASLTFSICGAVGAQTLLDFPAGNGNGGAGPGTAMTRHWITSANALCNDGSPAAAYIQAAPAGINENNWIIFFEGGGSCGSDQECLDRWQSTVDPDVGIQKMSTRIPRLTWNTWRGLGAGVLSPPTSWTAQTINGVSHYAIPQRISPGGIFANVAGNPFSSWNKVHLNYCSSDTWVGQNPLFTGTALDNLTTPLTPIEVTYDTQFRGADIFDGLIADLRSGVSACVTGPPGPICQTPPSLNNATTILIAGSSAGSQGAQANIDRFRADQKLNNTNTVVRGLFDAAAGADLNDFPFNTWRIGFSSHRAKMDFDWDQVMKRMWFARVDESCEIENTDLPSRCADITHVQRHHITTSFFARTDLLDSTVFGPVSTRIYPDAINGGSYPTGLAGIKLAKSSLENLQQLSDSRNQLMPRYESELDAITNDLQWIPSGVFAPRCGEHVGLVFANTFNRHTLPDAAGVPTNLVTAISNWLTTAPGAATSFAAFAPIGAAPMGALNCPP